MIADFINGSFEFLGGFALWGNVIRLHRDQQTRGITIGTTAFMSAWGYWNLYFYPSLGQWWSFYGGCNIVAANTMFLYLMWRYRDR